MEGQTQKTPLEIPLEEFEETRGRKSSFWHSLAVEYVKKRETDGCSRNEACREFQKKLTREFNYFIADKTVMDVVRSSYGRPQRGIANKKFVFSVLQNDLESSVVWYKRLSPKERRRWGEEKVPD